MTKMNESAIRTGIATSTVNNAPVKLKFKDSNGFDPYFGNIIEINANSFVIQYADFEDIVEFSEIDNLIS